jgi:hypothetical protein
MKQINLTSWEYQNALREAHRRVQNYERLGIRHEFIQGNIGYRNELGVCGEFAVGKWLGLEAHRVDTWEPGVADLGDDIEVRTAAYYRDPLYLVIRGNAHLERRFVLVVKTPSKGYHYDVVGWCYGTDAVEHGRYERPDSEKGGRHGAYWYDARILRDPEELKASLLWPSI